MSNTRVRLPRKLTKSVSGGTLAEAGRLHPVGSLSITLNMSPLNRVSMTLAENDLDLAIHDLVEVYNQNGSVGIYRVTKFGKTLRKERKIELSHGLDVFSDATIAKIQDWHGSVAQFLQMIIDAQTQKIGGQAYWQLGTCDDTNYWEKDIKYDNAMECLTEIAKTEEDFVFTFDQSTFPWTLNFVRRNDTVMSEFRLRRNTESCSITLDDSDLCTRLYLSVSAENEEEGGGTYFTEGYYTFNDATAQAKYGIVCKTAGIDQSVFSPTVDLEAWVAAYFARHNAPNVQISIDGMELNRLTGESFDEMHLGRICRVALPDYGDTYNERIVSVQYPDALRKPNYVQVSLHNKRQTAEDAFSEISSTASTASSTARAAGRGVHNTETYWRKTIGDTANGLYSRIEMTAYYIRSEVVDLANGMYSRIEQTASHIRSEVANTANGLRSQIEQTASYIRAEVKDTANGLSSRIEETASAISLKVSKGEVATELDVELNNVYVRGGNLIVDGYVTAEALNAELASLTSAFASNITTTTFSCVTGSARDFTVYGTFKYKASDEADAVSVLSAICGIGTAQESGGQFSIPTTTVGGSAGPSINFNIAASQTYIDGVAAARRNGRADMGLEADSENGVVKVIQGSTKSLAVTATEPEFTYNSSGHYYRATASAKAGDTVMHTVTSLNHSGTQAYQDGKTDGHGEMGVTADSETGKVKAAQSSTKELTIAATTPAFSYNTTTHKYTATAKAKAGDTELHTASNTSGTEAYDAGNANRASQITGLMSSTKTASQNLSADTTYEIVSQYQKADGTWANGGTYVVKTAKGTPYEVPVASGTYAQGWNAARAKIRRSGNTIYRPKAATEGGALDPGEEKAYTANYTASSNTYHASSHSNSRKQYANYYWGNNSGNKTDLSTNGSVNRVLWNSSYGSIGITVGVTGSDSYTPSSNSYTPSSLTWSDH